MVSSLGLCCWLQHSYSGQHIWACTGDSGSVSWQHTDILCWLLHRHRQNCCRIWEACVHIWTHTSCQSDYWPRKLILRVINYTETRLFFFTYWVLIFCRVKFFIYHYIKWAFVRFLKKYAQTANLPWVYKYVLVDLKIELVTLGVELSPGTNLSKFNIFISSAL